MINLQTCTVLSWTYVCYHIHLRRKTSVLIVTFIICCCIFGVVFHFQDKKEEAMVTEGTNASTTTQIVPTWTAFTLRPHKNKETTEPVFVPVLPKYARYQASNGYMEFNGDLLINNKSFATEILYRYSLKPGWTVSGRVKQNPESDQKPYVDYVARSIYIDAVFPPPRTKLTALQINDVRYLSSGNDKLNGGLLTVPIAQIYPDEAFVFLVEYFQIDLDRHKSPFNFKVNCL